jgi:hypothetical protein
MAAVIQIYGIPICGKRGVEAGIIPEGKAPSHREIIEDDS